ncbi:MAG: hypothetical protein RLZZ399_705 [Verrucomicrobiota bacterium]|jgi:hypothetical protein
MSLLPPFLEFPSEPAFQPPYLSQDVKAQVFVIDADLHALQRFCDERLNVANAETEYRVLAPFLLVSFLKLDRLSSLNPPDSEKGSLCEQEADFWMLLAAGHRKNGAFIVERLVWYVPYLWVDNGQALIAGREVFGFPKLLGRFHIPDPGQPGDLEAFSFVYPTFSHNVVSQEQCILRVCKPAQKDTSLSTELKGGFREMLSTLVHLFWDAKGELLLPGMALAGNLWKAIAEERQPMVFLKQFRDAVDPTRACYQAVLEADIHFTKLTSAGLLSGPHELCITNAASLPIVSQFGLRGTPRDGLVAVPVRMAYWAKCDFTIESARTIWNRTPNTGTPA